MEIECDECGATEEMWDEEKFSHVRSCARCGWSKFECDNCGTETSVVL